MSTSVPQPPRSRFLGLRRHLQWRRAPGGLPSTRFEKLVEGLDAIVWEIDLVSRRMTFVSRRVERLTGYPLSELLGDVGGFAERIVHPDDRELVSAEHARAAATGEKVEYECRVLLANGSTPWMRPGRTRSPTPTLTRHSRPRPRIHFRHRKSRSGRC